MGFLKSEGKTIHSQKLVAPLDVGVNENTFASKSLKIENNSKQELALKFDSGVDYQLARREATRQWREQKGYHLTEDFAGYEGPESYVGPHAYGYLKEADLKALADSGDIDAQVIYATFYLKDSPELAKAMLEDVVIKSEQTAPLLTLAGLILAQQESGASDPKKSSDTALSIDSYNDALAYLVYMNDRNDAIAKGFMQVSGFNSLSKNQQKEIISKASGLQRKFDAQRASMGLDPYTNSPLDIPNSMGISNEDFNHYEEEYSFERLNDDELESLRISTSYNEKYNIN